MGDGRHVRFTVESRGARARAVAFGAGAQLPVPEGERAEATFALEINEWRGVCEPRLVLRRARPAPGVPAQLPERELAGGEYRAHAPPRAGSRGREPARERPDEHEELVLFALER